MKDVLRRHFSLYPEMLPQDAVKLLYQSAFGGGHLITAPDEALLRLEGEREQVSIVPGKPLWEELGGGIVRLYLSSPECEDLPSSLINRMFVFSAAQIAERADAKERFLSSLDTLRELTKAGEAPFSLSALDAYLTEYRASGYPAVSHSEQYRTLYAPAYRVMEKRTAALLPLFCLTEALLSGVADPILIALDGPAASGKTTAAELFSSLYDCNVFHMDDYFLPPSMRTEKRLSSPGGNVHYERFREEILSGIASGEPFSYRRFSCSDGTLSEPISVMPKRLNVIEGSYSHHPELSDVYTLRVFLCISEEEQKTRILLRNGKEGLDRFLDRWIPLENRYFSAFDIKENADLILT